MKINEMYSKNPVYSRRVNTDRLFMLPAGSTRFGGVFDESIKFIAENQCKVKKNWILFAEQFKSNVDDENNGWRCEFWGKMMRGASFTYAYTKDPDLYEIMEDTVRDLLTTIDSLGRISSYSVEKEFYGWDMWGRKYVLLGLQYFMDVCEDKDLKSQAVDVMCKNLDYIISKIGREDEGKIEITTTTDFWRGLNSCSILEPVVRLYNITGKKEYLDFADYIVGTGGLDGDDNVFELAYEGKLYPYQYPVTKAYEMMSCFEGLMEYYRVTGIEKWKTAAINFANLVAQSDITIIGCSGCTHELFDNSRVRQANTENLIIMQETCVTITWIKFASQVLTLSGDPMLVDEIEKSVYNALFGAINTEHSDALAGGYTFDSYSPLLFATRSRQLGGTQRMRNNTEIYGCCVAIGAAGTGLIPSVATMLRKDGVAVNLYSKGTVNAVTPEGKRLTLKTKTEYPYDRKIEIVLSLGEAEKFTLALRIPAWSKKTTLCINGKNIKAKQGYTEITRKWQSGDKITLELDMRVRILAAQDDPDDANAKYHNALVYGPLVLARDARFGEEIDGVVNFAKDRDGYAVVKKTNTAKFPTGIELEVKQKNGSVIHVADYASCGKTWRRDSIMTAWMPTKEYWKVNLSKPVSLMLGLTGKYFFDDGGKIGLGEQREMWKIEKCGYYVRLKNLATGKYLSLGKKNDNVYAAMVDKAECDYQRWTLTHAVANRFTFENKMLGLQFYYQNWPGELLIERAFSEHFVSQTNCWREFIIKN